MTRGSTRGVGRICLGLVPVMVAVAALAGCSRSGRRESGARPAVVRGIGDRAVDFTIRTFNDGVFTLSSHAGRPVLINFWASWCGPCRLEGPMMEKLYRRYGPRGLTFVGVAIQDSEKGSRAYLEASGWTFPAGPDSDGRIMDAYSVNGIPKTVIIGPDGRVAYIQSGVMPEKYVAARIEEVLGRGQGRAAGGGP